MKWIAAAILVGAVIVSATIILTRPGTEVVETESAAQALGLAQAGWQCETKGEPLPFWILELLAKGEAELGRPAGIGDPEPDFRCTREAAP